VDIEAFEVASLRGTFVEKCNGQKFMNSSSPELAITRTDKGLTSQSITYVMDAQTARLSVVAL
jgi:hypothetical protein